MLSLSADECDDASERDAEPPLLRQEVNKTWSVDSPHIDNTALFVCARGSWCRWVTVGHEDTRRGVAGTWRD